MSFFKILSGVILTVASFVPIFAMEIESEPEPLKYKITRAVICIILISVILAVGYFKEKKKQQK